MGLLCPESLSCPFGVPFVSLPEYEEMYSVRVSSRTVRVVYKITKPKVLGCGSLL